MMGRIETAFKRYSKEVDIRSDRMPSDAYKEHVYIDTLSMHAPAIRCAYEYMGADQLLFGTDYPHRASGTVEGNLDTLDKVGFTDKEKQKIFARNAVELFKLK